MNLYNPKDIRDKISIVRYFRDQGIPLKNGDTRAVATWRDGNNPSVSIDDTKHVFFDHVVGAGGSVIDAYTLIEGGTPTEAIRVLGDRYASAYGIVPISVAKKPRKMTRGEMLVKDGYALVVTYTYTDADGNAVYFVDRYEREVDGKREKSFVQRSLTAENLDGVKKTLYNLPAVIKASQVFAVEGEKDVETMRRLGLVATTNSGGGKFWESDFNAYFDGKDVVVIADNDEVGEAHADNLVAQLKTIAKCVKRITPSKLPKGDVTDYIEKEGGTLASLMEMVDRAGEATVKDDADVLAAKEANTTPLVNWELGEIKARTRKDGTAYAKQTYRARRVDDICDDIRTRFLQFPRRLGGVLFDYTRNHKNRPGNRKIMPILTCDALRAWTDGTSGQQSNFMSGAEFASWKVVFERLSQTATVYDGIANAPWWPNRADVFPTYAILPTADPTHSKFDEFVAFFNPATEADATLIRAFFMSPMFFTGHDDRPAWCIDTVDAQQSGKTSVVKACAALYNETVLDMDLKTVNGDINQLKKRILSSEGRSKRIALFDNLDQTLKSGNLAQLVTADSITGMAPYGRGEETRRNDITWCATVNGADVDTDMATRTYTIHITAPKSYKPRWTRDLYAFIEANRAQIHADIIEMLQNAPERVRDGSRFPAFDATVLSAASATDEAFEAACAKIGEAAAASNEDIDRAAELTELVMNKVGAFDEATNGIKPGYALIIRSVDMDAILRNSQGALRQWSAKRVRRLIKTGCADHFVRDFERVSNGPLRDRYGVIRAFCFIPNGGAKNLSGTVSAQMLMNVGGILKADMTSIIKL